MAQRARTIIRFDGPALAGHEMDVHKLAPALLAVGELCRIANQTYNSDAASIKVLVKADTEQQCFQLKLELVQTLFHTLSALLDEEKIQDAKEILEWIGILSTIGATTIGGGLFGLYKFLSQKRPEDNISVSYGDSSGNVTYVISGNDNHITVPKEVDMLAKDPRALRSIQQILAPLEEDGYETLEFECGGQCEVLFTREEARRILQLKEDDLIIERDGELISTINTSVKVRKAIHEGDAAWGINYKRAVDAKMLDEDWLEDFQKGRINLPVGSRLVVELREIVPVDEDRIEQGPARYEVLKVHGVELPPEQYELLRR